MSSFWTERHPCLDHYGKKTSPQLTFVPRLFSLPWERGCPTEVLGWQSKRYNFVGEHTCVFAFRECPACVCVEKQYVMINTLNWGLYSTARFLIKDPAEVFENSTSHCLYNQFSVSRNPNYFYVLFLHLHKIYYFTGVLRYHAIHKKC